jgi:hypothetical protein
MILMAGCNVWSANQTKWQIECLIVVELNVPQLDGYGGEIEFPAIK